MQKTGRNDPCPCGSGRKFKQCCIGTAAAQPAPANAAALAAAGAAHLDAGRYREAEDAYRTALEAQPRHYDALYRLGAIALQGGRAAEALGYLDRALALRPDAPFALGNRGLALRSLARLPEALATLERAIALEPGYVEAHYNLALTAQDLGRTERAIAAYRRVLALDATDAGAHSNLGILLLARGDPAGALACYERAIAAAPEFVEAHHNRGVVLTQLGRAEEAVASFRAALAIDAQSAHAHNGLGTALERLNRFDEARVSYARALETDPDYLTARMNLLHRLQHACEWSAIEPHALVVRAAVRDGLPADVRVAPLSFAAIPGATAAEHRACAEAAAAHLQREAAPLATRTRALGRRRIGYLSYDFRDHPVAHLMAEVLALHDRQRFEVVAYGYGPDDHSAIGARVRRAVDRYVDLRTLGDAAAAARIREEEIDVLVDLTGYTQNARPGILAARPARVQLNYLGYPGTLGASFVDAIIADRFLIPPDAHAHYTERVEYLPSYLATDRQCAIGATPSRAECGLPESGFVFCCFNQSHKISADVFAIWMRLLAAVPQSVLWLLDPGATARANLSAAARTADVAPERLVFAPRVAREQHLGRLRRADLVVDTPHYNAGTTAVDALWAGVPLVTCSGETYPSRVAGSLLTAHGMPELITQRLDDYFELARTLALDPARLAATRAKVAAQRDTGLLFDSARTTRELEALYERLTP